MTERLKHTHTHKHNLLTNYICRDPVFKYGDILRHGGISLNFGGYGFPHSSVGKESTYNAGDPSLIPGSGRSPGEA